MHRGLFALLLGSTPWLSAQPVSDFHLQDVNAASARYGSSVSPRDYRLQISAYYFGLAG